MEGQVTASGSPAAASSGAPADAQEHPTGIAAGEGTPPPAQQWAPAGAPGGGAADVAADAQPPAEEEEVDDYDDEPEDEAEEAEASEGKQLRMRGVYGVVICLLSTSLFGMCGWMSGWQRHVIMAQPKAVYSVYKTISEVLPNEEGSTRPKVKPDKKWDSDKPEHVFTVKSGLNYALVPSLCDPPGETFDAAVEKSLCKVKLEAFCESLKRNMPNHDLQVVAEHAYKMCKAQVADQGGINIPLLTGPIAEEAQKKAGRASSVQRSNDLGNVEQGSSEDTVSELAQELGAKTEDVEPNFCETVADCFLMQDLRPWIHATIVIITTAHVAVWASILVHCYAMKKRSGWHQMVAWHIYFVGFLLFVAGIVVYTYKSDQIPAEKLVRKSELFYFMLPGNFDPPVIREEKMQGGSPASLLELGRVPPPVPMHKPLRELSSRSQDLRRRAVQRFGGGEVSPFSQSLVPHRFQAVHAGGPLWNAGSAGSLLALQQNMSSLSQWDIMKTAVTVMSMAGGKASKGEGGRPSIPASRWMQTILTLFGVLAEAIQSGEWGAFFDHLKNALHDAFRIADIIFKRWVYYVEKNLDKGPEGGETLLDALLEGVEELDKVEAACAKVGAECNISQHEKLRAEAKVELAKVSELSLKKKEDIKNLLKTCNTVRVSLVDIWSKVGDPVFRMIERIKKLFEHAMDEGVENALASGAQTVMDKYFTDDLKVLFQTLFAEMPFIMQNVRMVGRRWMALVQDMDTFVAQLAKALRVVHRLVVELLKTSATDVLTASQKLLFNLRVDILSQAAGFWTTLQLDTVADKHLFELKRELDLAINGDVSVGISTAAPSLETTTEASDSEPATPQAKNSSASGSLFEFMDNLDVPGEGGPGEASSLLEQKMGAASRVSQSVRETINNGGLAKEVQPFISGGLSDPSVRVGMVFLDQIGNMRGQIGFKSRVQLSGCSITNPWLCTQYSYAYWLYVTFLVCMLLAYVAFTRDFWKAFMQDGDVSAPAAPSIEHPPAAGMAEGTQLTAEQQQQQYQQQWQQWHQYQQQQQQWQAYQQQQQQQQGQGQEQQQQQQAQQPAQQEAQQPAQQEAQQPAQQEAQQPAQPQAQQLQTPVDAQGTAES